MPGAGPSSMFTGRLRAPTDPAFGRVTDALPGGGSRVTFLRRHPKQPEEAAGKHDGTRLALWIRVDISRRNFFGAIGGVLGAIGLAPDPWVVAAEGIPPLTDAQRAARDRAGDPSKRWVMVIDLARCDGCGKCSEACSKMHFIPEGREWIRVLHMKDSPDEAPYWFPKPCMHCDNPPCTKVCPVDATFNRQDGLVLIDNERCIGCRFCMAACPYSVRVFNWGPPHDPPEALSAPYSPEQGYPRRVGTVEKCDFCPHVTKDGTLPGCASVCPMQAIWFGDENEDAVTNSKGETVRLSELVRKRAGYRELEELGTKPRVYYLPPVDRLFPTPGETKNGPNHE